MKLSGYTYEEANYKLSMGYASEEDAREFVDTWNKVKTATRATLGYEIRRPQWAAYAELKVPVIYIKDLS